MTVIDPADRVERLRRAQPKRKRELDDRVPPGQFITKKFPVLTYGPTPQIDLETWQLRIGGTVEQEVAFNWEEFTSLPTVRIETDIHCVTRWTMLDTVWEGVSFRELVDRVRPNPDAQFVMQHSFGGYHDQSPARRVDGRRCPFGTSIRRRTARSRTWRPPAHGCPKVVFLEKREVDQPA